MAIIRERGDFQGFFNDLQRAVNKSIDVAFDRQFLTQLAKDGVTRIRERTQGDGKGVINGRPVELLKLRFNTRITRTFLKLAGILSNRTSPARSNLTETGQMIDSIAYEVNIRRRAIRFYFDNAEADRKAAAVTNAGRPFFDLTRADEIDLTGLAENELDRIIQRRTRNL